MHLNKWSGTKESTIYDEARATESTLERPKHSRWGSLGEVQEIVPILPWHRRHDVAERIGDRGISPLRIAKSRFTTPFRDVLDGLSLTGARLFRRGEQMRGTCISEHRVTPQWCRGLRKVEIRNTWWERRQFAGGPLPPPPPFTSFLVCFRPAFSPLRPVAVVFGAHCTISYENGSANYRPRRRASRSFSRCKYALRGSRCPRRENRGAT